MMTTRPGYRQIADDLRARITSGDLAEGDVLPSEVRLAEQRGVARGTAREALRLLEQEGRVRVSGRQRVVLGHATMRLRVSGAESVAFAADMAALGRETGQKVTVEIRGGTVVRRVLRYVDGEPHNLAEWTFPLNVASGTDLAKDEDLPGGSVAYLEEELGWTGLEQEPVRIRARMPSPDESRELRLPPGVPVLVEYRTGRANGKLLFTSERALRADWTELELDL